jgi:hypothetical protein
MGLSTIDRPSSPHRHTLHFEIRGAARPDRRVRDGSARLEAAAGDWSNPEADQLGESMPRQGPRVGIVVPTLGNRPDYLIETLKSVVDQGDSAQAVVVGPSSLIELAREFGASFCADPGGLRQPSIRGWRRCRPVSSSCHGLAMTMSSRRDRSQPH